MAIRMTNDQLYQQWQANGEPQGITWPDYKAQYLGQGGEIVSTSSASTVGQKLAPVPTNTTKKKVDPVAGTNTDFFGALATLPGADVRASPSDGSLDYYEQETAKINEALASPAVAPERKQELRAQQQQLDYEFQGQRADAAQKKLQGSSSDAEALANLQALEGLRSTVGGPSSSGIDGGVIRADPNLLNGLPVYDQQDEALMRQEWEKGPKHQGVSFEDYKAQVAAANQGGRFRYTSPTAKNLNGSPKTFLGLDDPPGNNSGETILRNQKITQQASLGYFDNVTSRAIADLGSKNKATDEEAKATLAKLAESGQLTKQQNTQIANKLAQEAQSSNARSSASTQRLTQAVTSTNRSNSAALDSYISGIKPYQTEIAGTTRQNVQFDPEGLAAQREALNQGRAIAGGSLDYQSQGAQAYANPEDIARALEGINMLRTNALEGGKDQKENLAIARKEFEEGGKNQQEVLDRFRDISTPEMTAAERAILNQSQRQFALHDKANRDAVTRDLEARGVMSGAGLIAQQQAAQQQLGEERVAGTLGAQAQAVQRAVTGLQGMHSAADSLRTGNQNAEQLMQAAANALRDGDLQAAAQYTAAAQRQREQGFQEEYSRGIAADNASANNQSTRLGGANIQANQANAIRSANDQINMFNNEQQGITDRYNTSFKQSEYERLAGLQQSTLNNRMGVNQTNLGNEFGLDTSTQRAIDSEWNRTNTAAQTGIGVNMSNWGIDQTQAGMDREAQEASRAAAERQTGTKIATADRRVELGRSTQKDVDDALRGLGYRV